MRCQTAGVFRRDLQVLSNGGVENDEHVEIGLEDCWYGIRGYSARCLRRPVLAFPFLGSQLMASSMPPCLRAAPSSIHSWGGPGVSGEWFSNGL